LIITSGVPNIIRRNRNSIAVLNGNEKESELEDLGRIYYIFWLGCRNVSKIFIPSGYDVMKLTEKWNSFSELINHPKYANNYDFNKAVYLINKERFHDTGFLLLKEDTGLSSPLAVLYFDHFKSKESLSFI